MLANITDLIDWPYNTMQPQSALIHTHAAFQSAVAHVSICGEGRRSDVLVFLQKPSILLIAQRKSNHSTVWNKAMASVSASSCSLVLLLFLISCLTLLGIVIHVWSFAKCLRSFKWLSWCCGPNVPMLYLLVSLFLACWKMANKGWQRERWREGKVGDPS